MARSRELNGRSSHSNQIFKRLVLQIDHGLVVSDAHSVLDIVLFRVITRVGKLFLSVKVPGERVVI